MQKHKPSHSEKVTRLLRDQSFSPAAKAITSKATPRSRATANRAHAGHQQKALVRERSCLGRGALQHLPRLMVVANEAASGQPITSAAANSSEEASRSTAERKAENAEVLQQCLVVAYVLCLATNLPDHLHPHMLL